MMTQNPKAPLINITLAVIVFVASLCIGYALSRIHPLANDELFTQVASIEHLSYADILTLRIPEGNVSPLFYLIQKTALDLFHFRLPFVWNGDWFVKDLASQVMMRIPANIFMSLAITFVFYFFSRVYSPFAGIYSLLISFSSYMVWAYWAEARPFPLWYLLTTIQVLSLLYLLKEKREKRRALWALTITHLLLALTVVFGAVQIAAASLILFLSGERKGRKYFALTVLPVILCFCYYFGSPRYSFFFSDSPIQLICASLPKERLALIIVLGGVLNFIFHDKGKRAGLEVFKDPNAAYLAFFVSMLMGNAAILILFMIKAHGRQDGFPLSNRYFIDLVPVGTIALTLFSVEMWRRLREKVNGRVILVLVLAVFLVFRLMRTWELVRGYYHV